MTPEDRKALIYRCQDAVAHLTQMVEVGIRGGRYSVTEYRYQLMINEIALASLNAQPIGRVDRGEVSDNNEYPDARVVCLHDQADWENFPDGTDLFLQSVPAIDKVVLVPGVEALRAEFEEVERKSDDGFNLHRYDTVYADDETQERWELWLSCRAAILRNIEEAK